MLLSEITTSILLLICIGSGLVIHRPRNTVGVVDKNAVIACSVNNGRDIVDWFYRGSTGKTVQISRGFTILEQRFYEKFEIIYNYYNQTLVMYDLLIRKLNLSDTGTYCCSIITEVERITYMASLSIFIVDKCEASFQDDLLVQKCWFRTTGRVLYYMSWYCMEASRDSQATGTEEVTNMFKESIRVNLIIQSAVVKLPPKNRNLTTCVLDVRASQFAQHIIEHFDSGTPSFDLTIFFMSKKPPHLVRPNLERCKPDKDGKLPLREEIVFSDQYLQTHRILKEETTFMSYNCKRIAKPSSVSMKTDVDPYINFVAAMSCEDKNALDCYKNFTYFIQPASNMLYMNTPQYRSICSDEHKESIERCMDMSKPCVMTKKMKGIQETYDFLCSSNYEAISQPLPHINNQYCFEHYPQVMATVYGKKYIRQGLVRDMPLPNATSINQMFCRHMSTIGEIFCIQHLIASVGNIDLSHWYLKFVGLLKQIDYYSLTPIYEGILRIPIFDCEQENSNIVTRTLCFESRNCTPIFSLLVQATTFGFVVVQNYRKLESEVCSKYDVELKSCLTNFFEHCDTTTRFIYKPMMALKEALCGRFKKAYQQHEVCFLKYYVSSEIHQHCNWATKFYDLYAFDGSQQEMSFEICRMGLHHINCIYKLVAASCGKEAGKLQKMLLKIIFKVAFERLYCHNVFSLRGIVKEVRIKNSADIRHINSIFILITIILLTIDITNRWRIEC